MRGLADGCARDCACAGATIIPPLKGPGAGDAPLAAAAPADAEFDELEEVDEPEEEDRTNSTSPRSWSWRHPMSWMNSRNFPSRMSRLCRRRPRIPGLFVSIPMQRRIRSRFRPIGCYCRSRCMMHCRRSARRPSPET